MRKQNTKTTVPLDVVPERRTERCSPRFRPGGRFCELRFRYQSSPTGSEGEISRPLDHMRQIPFIHSTRFILSSNFCIYNTAFQLFPTSGTFKYVFARHIYQLRMRSKRAIIQVVLYSIQYMLVQIGSKQMALTHAHLLSNRNSSFSRPIELFPSFYLLFPIPSFKLLVHEYAFAVDAQQKTIFKEDLQICQSATEDQ